MSKLKEFVDEVAGLAGDSDLVTICRESAIAAAGYIRKRLDAAKKGGVSSNGGGRKITNRTKKATKQRIRMRKYRAKKGVTEDERLK